MDASVSATKPGRLPVVAAMFVSTFMAATEVTIISTAMPTIVARLGGFGLFSWAFGIYLLAQAVTTPLYGRLADSFGRRRSYLACAAIFLLGSLLCGLAWSMPSLIVFRAIQGLGGGGLIPLSTIIISDVTSDDERPRMLSYVSLVWGFAGVIGPLLGSLCVSTLGWPFVFWINLPLGLLSIALALRFLPDPAVGRAAGGLNWLNAALLAASVGTGMEALIQWQTLAAGSLAVLLGTGLLCLAGFVWAERRVAEPIVPAHLLRQRLNLAANGNSLLIGALLIACTAFVPTWVQGVAGRTTLASGVVLGFELAGWVVTALVLGRLLHRLDARPVALCSALAIIAGCAGLLLLRPGSLAVLLVSSLVVGVGFGSSSLVFTVAVQSGSAYAERGRATSLFYFCRLLGQAVGSAVFGGVLNRGLQRGGTGSGALEALLDPASRAALPGASLASLVGTLDTALHGVFAAAVVLAAATALVALIVPRASAVDRA